MVSLPVNSTLGLPPAVSKRPQFLHQSFFAPRPIERFESASYYKNFIKYQLPEGKQPVTNDTENCIVT